jgi:hypothetical protein
MPARTTCATALLRSCSNEGRSIIYVARQLGHDARLTLTRYGHVIDELEDTPRIEAEAAIPTRGLRSELADLRPRGNATRDKGVMDRRSTVCGTASIADLPAHGLYWGRVDARAR